MRRDSWRWMHIAIASWIGAVTASAADAPPSFLVVIADDCSYSELPLFGGRNVRTPHIDRLADDGILFRRAYVSMSMCVPCRAELYTGLYPLRSGVAWNHSSARAGTVGIVQRLEPYGYRTGIAGKVHATPRSVFPFELSNLARDPAHTPREGPLWPPSWTGGSRSRPTPASLSTRRKRSAAAATRRESPGGSAPGRPGFRSPAGGAGPIAGGAAASGSVAREDVRWPPA